MNLRQGHVWPELVDADGDQRLSHVVRIRINSNRKVSTHNPLLFLWQKGREDLLNIRQLVIMLWLIWCIYTERLKIRIVWKRDLNPIENPCGIVKRKMRNI